MSDNSFSSMFILKTLSIKVADWSENLVGSVILGSNVKHWILYDQRNNRIGD